MENLDEIDYFLGKYNLPKLTLLIIENTNRQTSIVEREKVIKELTIKTRPGASLVVQWLRVCLPMQGTRVRALVWEDPTCHGATGPVSHNY